MMSTSRLKCSWSCGRYSWSKPRRSAGFTFCTLECFDGDALLRVFLLHVGLDYRLEFVGESLAFQRAGLLAIDSDRGDRHFARAGQADADVRVLGFARTVDHAAHHRDAHVFHAGIRALPDRHLRAQISLDALGKLLEHGA